MALSQKHVGKMLVPWFNSNEWRYVKDLIFQYSSTQSNKEKALSIIRMWKIRTPKLPSGVEGTLILLDVMLQNRETVSEEDLRIISGSALMRFLNLCGAGSDKQGSFYKMAKQNNIPSWLINLRHDVAHDQVIPSQYMLDLALEFCFNWLKREYWEEQSRTITDFVSVDDIKMNIAAMLELYCQINIYSYANQNISSVEDFATIDEDLYNRIWAFDNVNINRDTTIAEVLDILLQNISKIINGKKPKQAELIASFLLKSGSLFGVDLLVKEDGNLEIPYEFGIKWQKMISFLYTENMLFPLLKHLFKLSNNVSAENHIRQMASLWFAEILKSILVAKCINDKFTNIPGNETLHKECVIKCLENNIELQAWFKFDFENCTGVVEDIRSLHMEAVKNPHEFTSNFLKYLLQICDCSPNCISEMEELVKTYAGAEEMVESDYQMPVLEEVTNLNLDAEDNVESGTESQNYGDPPDLSFENQVGLNVLEENVSRARKFRIVEDKSIFNGCPLGVLSFQRRDVNPVLEYL